MKDTDVTGAPTIDVNLVSPIGSQHASLPVDTPLRSFLGDLLASLGLNGGGGATAKWALTRGDGQVISADRSLAAERVSAGDDLRLVRVSSDEPVSVSGTTGPPSKSAPTALPQTEQPQTAQPASEVGDGASLRSRTRALVPGRVPSFKRMAASVKAAATTPSPAALELLGNRGPYSPSAKGVFSPRPADPAAGRSPSALERARAEWRVTDRRERLDAELVQPRLRRCATIAIVSPKGGVGKTTLTALLGMLLSHIRRDRIVAVDTNPDYGTLGRVLTPDQSLFVDDLLRRMAHPDLTQTELDSQLGRATHGLMVLPSPTDPQRMAQLDEPGYQTVISRLNEYVGVVILDCGTGLHEPAVKAALTTCDQIVLVTDAEPATANLVAEASTPLAASGRPITVVVNKVPKKSRLDLDRFATFVPTATAMLTIPANAAGADLLGSGGFDWRRAPKPWAIAVRELAVALVGDWSRLGITFDPEAEAKVEAEG